MVPVYLSQMDKWEGEREKEESINYTKLDYNLNVCIVREQYDTMKKKVTINLQICLYLAKY